MKAALIVPNTRETRTKSDLKEVPLITPPLNLMYLAQAIINKGHDAYIIDSYVDIISDDFLIKKCKQLNPDVFFIPIYSTDLGPTNRIINNIKQHFPEVPIIGGGPHPSHMPIRTMEEFQNVDIITKGEGEVITQLLLDALENDKPLDNIPSIAFRKNNKIISNPYKKTITSLDEIAIPNRKLIQGKKYYSKMFKKNPVDVLITSRGCPYQCIFCAKISDDFKKYRIRSVDNVMEEIKTISENGAKSLEIYDECFTVKKDRCHEILNEMRKEKIDMEFRIRTRVNVVDKPLLQNLKKTGCSIISYGVESGNQSVLNINKKGTTLQQVTSAFKLTHKVGIATLGFFLVGLEGDTPKTIKDTINFAKKINPHYTTFGHVIPYPGTEMYANAKKNNTLVGDWHLDKPMPYVKLPWLKSKEEALSIVSNAYKKFYYRPTYAMQYLYRLLKRKNYNQIIYSLKNIRSNLAEVNSVVVNEDDKD